MQAMVKLKGIVVGRGVPVSHSDVSHGAADGVDCLPRQHSVDHPWLV